MRVFIKPSGPASQHARGAALNLPAGKPEILEAMDQARIPYGSGEYIIDPDRNCPDFINKLCGGGSNPSIAEMNHLAERMAQLSEDELHTLDVVMKIFPPSGGYGIVDAIDATHNLHRHDFHPVATNDYELGTIVIDSCGDLFPPIAGLSDEILDCLDPAKIGKLTREQDGGVFTANGYLIPHGSMEEWTIVCDRSTKAERVVTLASNEPIITLRVRPFEDLGGHEFSLELPASQQHIETVLRTHGVPDLSEYIISGASSVIPALDYAITEGEDIEKVNELACAIKALGGEQFAKYKAAYELEIVTSIESAITVAKRLDEYDFSQLPTTAEYGKAVMEQTGADVKLLTEYGFDFGAYGWKVMDENKIGFVSYGFISHPRGQELTMEQAVESPEPESPTIEPTMTM